MCVFDTLSFLSYLTNTLESLQVILGLLVLLGLFPQLFPHWAKTHTTISLSCTMSAICASRWGTMANLAGLRGKTAVTGS